MYINYCLVFYIAILSVPIYYQQFLFYIWNVLWQAINRKSLYLRFFTPRKWAIYFPKYGCFSSNIFVVVNKNVDVEFINIPTRLLFVASYSFCEWRRLYIYPVWQNSHFCFVASNFCQQTVFRSLLGTVNS
jgi:hypothetical protein